MTRRVPLAATIVVLLAVAAMIGLGIWQLHRAREKQALVARATANLALPPIALPAFGRFDEALRYRRATAFCLQPTGWKTEAGRARDGTPGWRHIALCRTGAEGPGFAADAGVSRAPANPRWAGGAVSGRLTTVPGDAPLIARLFGRAAPPPMAMVVALVAAPGLQASEQPGPDEIANNHIAYAVQWFVFAGLAAGIYALLLWRRGSDRSPPPSPPRT